MSEKLIELRLYLYDSNQLNGCGTELQNVMIGAKISSCLDDTQDTAEITLNGITTKTPYAPLTKFVAVLSQEGQETQYLHYELRYDLVEKLSMSKDLYKHSLYLANPAISCQKRTCDNFSISYKLKDVRLDNTSYSDKYRNYIVLNNDNGKDTRKVAYSNFNNIATFGSDRDFGALSSNEFIGAKYFTWQHDKGTYYASSDLIDISKLNQAMFINSSKITTSIAEKCKTWCEKVGGNMKFQIMDYDSTNAIYGSGAPYEKYFEPIDQILHEGDNVKNLAFKYCVPKCLAWLSDSYNNEINIASSKAYVTIDSESPYQGGSKTNMIIMPTVTTIKDTNLSTGENTETTIYSYYGPKSQDVHKGNSVDFPYYLDKKSIVLAATDLQKYQPEWNMLSNYLVGFDMMSYGSYANNKILTPIFLDGSNWGANTEYQITFTPQHNHKYQFTTRPYFGVNGVDRYCFMPTNDEGRNIEKTLYNGTALNSGEIMTQWHYYRNGKDNYYLDNVKNTEQGFTYQFEISFYNINSEPQLLMLTSQTDIPTCYDLFRKAQIATKPILFTNTANEWNTLDNNKLPYVISNETKVKLLYQKVIEDKYYNKNLWEMFMQIGKYVHAKPYIRFYQNKYELLFKDYGVSEQSSKKATSNSIFSNYNIESYISSLDSYIENYFEYGNEVEEYIRPTDNDGTSICTNDNAILKTKYPIEEITYLGVKAKSNTSVSSSAWKNITDYIYEHNIYKCLNILQVVNDISYYHFKGNSIYYHLGETSIQGFQYCEPSTATETKPYAIKRILAEVMGKSADNIQVNDYMFLIRYRTKDDVRFKTFKPDLRKFMYSSDTDNYPTQTQFNNQSDKIVDSAKYGNNVYGTLIRSGNQEVEYQEYVTEIDKIKDSGELYSIDSNQYYVAKNTYAIYPTYVDCEVNYTKDFNKLSEIIGIDSAPRFYEIPEDGSIKRNISFDRIFQVSLATRGANLSPIRNVGDLEALRRIYNNEVWKYCVIDFKGATKNYNTDTNNFHSNVCVPCNEYATANTLTLECDMADNYGAGERQIDMTTEYAKMYVNSSWIIPLLQRFKIGYEIGEVGTITERQSVQYCDVYGKADLISFIFVEDIQGYKYDQTTYSYTWYEGYLNLPCGDTNTMVNLYMYNSPTNMLVNKKPVGTIYQNSQQTAVVPFYYVLDKDARETIGINYSIHLTTGSDQFVLSNNVFRRKKDKSGNYITKYKWFFLDKEVNKYERENLNATNVIAINDAVKDNYGDYIDYFYKALEPITTGVDLSKVKAIAFGYIADNQYYYIIARNVPIDTESSVKATKWYFYLMGNN